jgi:hypothetical protein
MGDTASVDEILCILLVILPAAGAVLALVRLVRRAPRRSLLTGFTVGAGTGAYLVGVGEFAFQRSMSCLAAGALFQFHAAIFTFFEAFLLRVTTADPSAAAARLSGAAAVIWQCVFWVALYGGAGAALGWVVGRRSVGEYLDV